MQHAYKGKNMRKKEVETKILSLPYHCSFIKIMLSNNLISLPTKGKKKGDLNQPGQSRNDIADLEAN